MRSLAPECGVDDLLARGRSPGPPNILADFKSVRCSARSTSHFGPCGPVALVKLQRPVAQGGEIWCDGHPLTQCRPRRCCVWLAR